ncbi:MAG: biopolymer transporter ExbD [Deltaproteobacteria bacterium]|nr:biopolymer transporter ExbD [Deltaproteobacteria bacterium]
MAGQVDSDDEVLSDINITPFVDVVLVLLIILMVTSVDIVKASLVVELPKAASGKEAIASTLNVVITEDETLYLDGEKMTEEALIAKTKSEAAKSTDLQAVIAADKKVPYGVVVRVIDLVKSNGVKAFALNIERVPAPEAKAPEAAEGGGRREGAE